MLFATVVSLSVLGQVVLPGSNKSVEQAKEESSLIVVAEMVTSEFVIGTGALVILTGVELKPSTVLKGELKEGELKNVAIAASGAEVLPKEGENYIVFATRDKGIMKILKMLPRTDENIAAVKESSE